MTHFHGRLAAFLLVLSCLGSSSLRADDLSGEVAAALQRAGSNRPEIQTALEKAPADEREGMRFLVAYMPTRDLTTLKADFLLDNVQLAYRAFNEAPWKAEVPREIFLNDVLPYASINERRDNWRKDYYERFKPLVAGIATPGKAGAKLNDKIFALLKVRFSKNRPKADQSPYETTQAGMASCTGLSVLLVDACRSVGVPARFVGTPIWSDMSGNHSWVEIWDRGGWHFTGAAEAYGEKLDVAWFTGRAAAAERDDLLHAIYAASYRPTPQVYPLLWAPQANYVYAVNVTDRYAQKAGKLAAGQITARFRVLDRPGGARVAARLKLFDSAGKVVCDDVTRDERFDDDDELIAALRPGKYHVEIRVLDLALAEDIEANKNDQRFVFHLTSAQRRVPARFALSASDAAFLRSGPGQKLSAALKQYFDAAPDKRAAVPLDASLDALVLTHSAAVRKLAWAAYRAGYEGKEFLPDLKARRVTYKEYVCPYVVRAVGSMPPNGWPLFIAMHGGGGAPQELNDSQWRIMQIYYRDQPQLGGYLYLAIRAPNNTWNGFYDWYNLPLTDKLIRELLLAAHVDSNKVYLMGYSHGGYGAFFIGPQLADRFAAIHASAAAPSIGNEVGKNFRNTPFTYMVGEHDNAYGRLSRCRDFDKYIRTLRGERKDVYPVTMEYVQGAQHSNLPDRDKIKDLYPAVRKPVPREVTWLTTYDVVRTFAWLHVPKAGDGREVDAACRDNKLVIKSKKLDELDVYLDERLVDYAKPLAVDFDGRHLTEELSPSLRTLCETLAERGDPELMFATRLVLKHKPPAGARKE